MSDNNAKYDETYKRLFTNVELLEEIIRYFISEELADALDFSKVDGLETTTFSQDLEKRESDRIIKIKLEDGEDLYLILMLEFQSSNDPSMVVRIWNYLGRLFEEQVRLQGKGKSLRLPLVLPVVIHNGDGKWTAATELDELIEGSDLWGEVLLMRLGYHCIDCGSMEYRSESILSNILHLEHPLDRQSFEEMLFGFAQLVKSKASDALKRDIRTWFEYVLERKTNGQRPTQEQLDNFFEEDEMSRERVNEILDGYYEEGYQEGQAEGREEGRQQESQHMLELLLAHRFGEDATRRGRIEPLSREQCERATEVLFRVDHEDAFWEALISPVEH
ncbi:MAG: Rpn family recombination-promoting nuclease/putative transposase [Myxococcota bacterium]|nr:Rpn family recombination-promoting nuclease/putative transposase [Myxococcota bacterium]